MAQVANVGQEDGWRLSFLVPAIITGLVACGIMALSDEAAEGATFGIVPYVCPEGLGGVCAVVGAWGNIGAVAWGMMFKFGYIGNFEQGYIAMGYIIIASSVFTIFMRIKGQSSVLCGDQ